MKREGRPASEARRRSHWTYDLRLTEILTFPPLAVSMLAWLATVALFAFGAIEEGLARFLTSVASAFAIGSFVVFLRRRVPDGKRAELEAYVRRWRFWRLVIAALIVVAIALLRFA